MPNNAWIEVTSTTRKKKIWVNMAQVTHVEVSGNHTVIYFDKNNRVSVTETPRWVLAGIGVGIEG
jgi:hypothetical protein